MVEINVLSIRQPWAGAILSLGKWVENRSWTHATKYRGPLYLHASRWDARPPAQVIAAEPWLAELWDDPTPASEITGAIIGVADLVYAANQHDTVEAFDVFAGMSRRKLTPHQQAAIEHFPDLEDDDAWKWWSEDGILVLRNPRQLLKPIEVGGKLGIWKLPVNPGHLTLAEPAACSSKSG